MGQMGPMRRLGQIHHGSHSRIRKERSAVALALVLQHDAQDVRQDLTPVKMQMRVPGLVWGSIGMEAGLGRKRRVSLRFIQLGKVRTAARIGCPF